MEAHILGPAALRGRAPQDAAPGPDPGDGPNSENRTDVSARTEPETRTVTGHAANIRLILFRIEAVS